MRARLRRALRFVFVLLLVVIPVPGVQVLSAIVLRRKRAEVTEVKKQS